MTRSPARPRPPRTPRRAARPHPPLAALAPALDGLITPLVDGQWLAGAVIGLFAGDDELVRGYGHSRDGSGDAPDARTVFEIGSVTKAFTGLLFADALGRGEVAIDTTAQSLLPDGVVAPGAPERPVLLLDLATHLSGLPRLPPSLHPANTADPYAEYDEARLFADLPRITLRATPGERYEYSNLGYGLLGTLLARRAGATYAQLLADRVTVPLGMADTTLVVREDQQARLAQGHTADGDPTPLWAMNALAGAGAVRSTAGDMLRFVRANARPQGPLADAIVRSHVLRRAIDAPPGYVALGWHVQSDRRTVWHNGETGGFHAYAAFDAREDLGVVVLANTASARVDEVGVAALRLLRGQPVAPIDLPRTVAVDDAHLAPLAGVYALAPGADLVVTHETGGVLRARLGAQPRFRVYPSSATEFRYRVVDAALTFELDASGAAVAVVLHQGGRDLRAPRTAAPPTR